MTYNENEMTEMNEQTEKQERTSTFFRFEDLRIYHKALDYITWLQDVTSLFPDTEKSQLAVRFNDSARNIALYIAEGSARNKTQFIYYLRMAKSSIRQCMVYTTLSYGMNLMTENYEDESRTQLMEMTKMIGALISSLQRSMGNSNGNGYHHNGNGRHKKEEEYTMGSFDENYLPEE
ncbi:MAG: four helix bundle protein [Bacteroidales bacterium]|nr:four helix bundle protein [Bacteroidales bacterium]